MFIMFETFQSFNRNVSEQLVWNHKAPSQVKFFTLGSFLGLCLQVYVAVRRARLVGGCLAASQILTFCQRSPSESIEGI